MASMTLVWLMGSTSVSAQTAECDISVLGYSARPGGYNIPEAYVEVRNHGTHFCKVSVDRGIGNPNPYTDCPDCTTQGCGTAPPSGNGYLCQTTNSTGSSPLIVGPCDSSTYCTTTNDCMPGGPVGAECCDNKTNPSSCNGAILGTPGEFCSHYGNMLVIVTAKKAPTGKNPPWVATNDIVCVRGTYEATYPTAPVCDTASYCDAGFGSRTYRTSCQPGNVNNCVVW